MCRPTLALLLFQLAALPLLSERAQGAEHSAHVDLGVERQKSDWLLIVEPALSIKTRPFELDLAAPLRFDLERSFHLWERDWDHLSDAGRVLRRASLDLNDGAIRVFLGFLSLTSFGHGSIVQTFTSSFDPDVMPLGASAHVQVGPVTVEALVSDVFGPEVIGTSVALEPISLSGRTYDRLHLIASIVGDPTSPGAWHDDGARRPSNWALIYGLGLDWTIVRAEHWQMATYADVNFNGLGLGVHAGLLADVLFEQFKLSFKGEWRWAKAPYAPDYFDHAYTIERRDFWSGADLPLAKAIAVEDSESAHSGKLELRVESGPLSATAVLSGMGQDLFNTSLIINVIAGDFDFSLFGALRHFEFGHDPDRVMGLAEARYRFLDYFYVWLSGGQLYRFDDDGRARPLPLWSTGVGAAFLLRKPKRDARD